MTPEELAAAVKDPVSRVGGGFMRSREALAAAGELGLEGWTIYVAGRGGVLGEVDADVVTAALVFFPRDWVRRQWEAARPAVAPAEATAAYLAACHAWGRRRLEGLEGAARLAELAERVAAAADPAGRVLFAGWRALPRPEQPLARAGQALNVLREHRGNSHALAVLTHGLTPLEALLAGPGGSGSAGFFSWPEPYPDPAPLRARWQAAEDATGAMVAPAFAVLDPAEREEFAALTRQAAELAFPPR